MKTYKIYLIRHGLTKENTEGLYIGHTDVSLSDEGKRQLFDMKNDYEYPKADFVFSSPLKRSLETVEILYPNAKPIIVDDLIEYNFGEFENMDAATLHEKQPLFDKWLCGDQDVTPPFGESNREFVKRVCEGFVKIVNGILKANADNTAIITHGGVITTILANFGLPEASSSDWMTPSGCGYTLRLQPEIWTSQLKLEVFEELPKVKYNEEKGNYYDGWDYYPEDNSDISEYI